MIDKQRSCPSSRMVLRRNLMRMQFRIAVGVGMVMLLLYPSLNWAQTSDERLRQLEQELLRMRQDVEALKKTAAQPYQFPINLGASITVRYDVTSVEDKADVRLDTEQN